MSEISWTPNGSTSASTVGGSLTIVAIALWEQFFPGVHVTAITAAALATLFAAGLGYLPKSGRLPNVSIKP
jgi:hypothetical protein